ncbi:hypothetical protein LINPERHAP1_LOCUS13008, partial [Linum perenne]
SIARPNRPATIWNQIGQRLSGTKSAGDYLEPNRPATIWNQIGRRLLLLVRTCPSVLFFMDTSTGGDGSSNKNSSSTASTKGVGVKQKTDIAWNYFEDLIDENGNKNDAPVNTMNELTRSGSSGPVRVSTVDDYFAPRTVAGDQPGIKAALAGKEALHRAQLMVAKFFYDAGFAFNAAHSPYYQASYSAAAAIGPGFVVPSYHALRTNLLADCKRECQLLVEGYRETWAKHGCTLMSDGWTDKRGRT